MFVLVARAWQPIISDIGNGQGCEAKYLTSPQTIPASSSVSRLAASSMLSPGSTKPARHDHMLATKRPARPSRQLSPSTASMITTGSVRGKCSTLHEGHSRFQPACTMLVFVPQFEQKRC